MLNPIKISNIVFQSITLFIFSTVESFWWASTEHQIINHSYKFVLEVTARNILFVET